MQPALPSPGRSLLIALLWILTAFAAGQAHSDEVAIREIIARLAATPNFGATESVVHDLAVTGDALVVRPLAALSEGNLVFRKADGQVFIGRADGRRVALLDPLTGEPVGEAAK